jgi:hypothetical protein
MRATCPAHLIRLDLTCLMIFHSPVTSSLLGPNILLRTLFSNTLSLCSSLSVRAYCLLTAHIYVYSFLKSNEDVIVLCSENYILQCFVHLQFI